MKSGHSKQLFLVYFIVKGILQQPLFLLLALVFTSWIQQVLLQFETKKKFILIEKKSQKIAERKEKLCDTRLVFSSGSRIHAVLMRKEFGSKNTIWFLISLFCHFHWRSRLTARLCLMLLLIAQLGLWETIKCLLIVISLPMTDEVGSSKFSSFF